MGRMIDWRNPNPQVHMAYNQMPVLYSFRSISYNVYNPNSQSWPQGPDNGCILTNTFSGWSGFVNIDVNPSGEAVIAGHVFNRPEFYPTDSARTTVFKDLVSASCMFTYSQVPNELAHYGALNPEYNFMWPKFEYHIFGDDTVLYAFSSEGETYNNSTEWRALTLYRMNSADLNGTWQAFTLDTVDFINQDITASRVSPRVACCWLRTAAEGVYRNNDVWYLISNDMGATWETYNKINVTDYQPDEEGYRAWLELSCLFDTNDDLHIVWNACKYYGDRKPASGRAGRLFHWSEYTAYINTVTSFEWDPLRNCGQGGANSLNISRVSISECDGRLYIIWNQFGDPDNGDSIDCANPNVVPSHESYNADIYLSVSTNLSGYAWDKARNLTNTKTPGCDDNTFNECANEVWPSMSRYGMDNLDFMLEMSDWPPEAMSVDPSYGYYSGSHYLDVMYVNDVVPGMSDAIPEDNDGVPYNNPIKWFRLPCVDPIPGPVLFMTPTSIAYPEYTRHGEEKVYSIFLENLGNVDLNALVFCEKDTYSSYNWLYINKTYLSIPAGYGNKDSLEVVLNKYGVINYPGTVVNLVGRVGVEWNQGGTMDTSFVEIDFYVADTIAGIAWDTISTNHINLVVSSNGNMGHQSAGEVNMDFYNTLDCDNYMYDYYSGNSKIYLNDASPIILSAEISGSDTSVTASWSIFNSDLASENIFKPVTGHSTPQHMDETAYEGFHTGTFITVDSTLAIEKDYYAPKEDVSFIIQCMKIFPYDGAAHVDVTIGEAYDWDIPSDSGVYNYSDVSIINQILYMVGGEWDDLSLDSIECIDNDLRLGGAVFIGYYTNHEYNADPSVLNQGYLYSGYAALNSEFQHPYPAGELDPLEVYRKMVANSGFEVLPYEIKDQHIVLTFFEKYDFSPTDTLYIWSALASVYNGDDNDLFYQLDSAKNWFAEVLQQGSGCPGVCGDFDNTGDVNVVDLIKLINWFYLEGDPPYIQCVADVDGVGGISNNDVISMIDYIYITHSNLDCEPTYDTIFPSSYDTLELENCVVNPGNDKWSVNIRLYPVADYYGLSYVFSYACPTSNLILDSIIFNSAISPLPPFSGYELFDNDSRKGSVAIVNNTSYGTADLFIATLYFSLTAAGYPQVILFDTTEYPAGNKTVLSRIDAEGNKGYTPAIIDDISDSDTDLDGIEDVSDNCVDIYNPDQADYDGDGVGDVCDNCPIAFNSDQSDDNQDGIGNACTFEEPTPVGTDVNVNMGGDVDLTFENVATGGTTEMTVTVDGPETPSSYTVLPLDLPVYYNITTTSSYTGVIEVCIQYDDAGLTPDDEINLTLYHYDGAMWVDITTYVDTDNNIVCGETMTLSPFIIGFRTGCCVGYTGNADCSAEEEPDISDITRLIDYLYLSHAPLCCMEEADADASGGEPDISDITRLIDYLYLSHTPLATCP